MQQIVGLLERGENWRLTQMWWWLFFYGTEDTVGITGTDEGSMISQNNNNNVKIDGRLMTDTAKDPAWPEKQTNKKIAYLMRTIRTDQSLLKWKDETPLEICKQVKDQHLELYTDFRLGRFQCQQHAVNMVMCWHVRVIVDERLKLACLDACGSGGRVGRSLATRLVIRFTGKCDPAKSARSTVCSDISRYRNQNKILLEKKKRSY